MHVDAVVRGLVVGGLAAVFGSLGYARFETGNITAAETRGSVLRVLAVGVGRYRDQKNLSYPVKDARAVASALQKHAAGLFERVEVRLLTNDEANRRAVLAALEALRTQARPGDVAVIYYSGHAANDPPVGFYLAPGRYNDKFWRDTMLAGADLHRAWAAIPGRVVVLLDTCFTGALWEPSETPTASRDELSRSFAVVSATRTSEETHGGNRFWHADFTQALLEALDGAADADHDGVITLGELESHLDLRVNAHRGSTQHVVSVVPSSLRSVVLGSF